MNNALEEHIIAYIDLLGVKEKIKKGDLKSKDMIHHLYSWTIDVTPRVAISENAEIKFKIFSDNIVIAKKLSKESTQRERDIRALLMCTGHFQEMAATDTACCMLRGGITIGELLIDETMVWGQALVDAYKIESTVANYPRIVITDSVAREIMNYPKLNDYLRTDFDDCYFLNYLADCYYVGELLEAGFERMKEDANLSDPKIKQKFIWHMKFLNTELKKKKEKYRLSL